MKTLRLCALSDLMDSAHVSTWCVLNVFEMILAPAVERKVPYGAQNMGKLKLVYMYDAKNVQER